MLLSNNIAYTIVNKSVFNCWALGVIASLRLIMNEIRTRVIWSREFPSGP